MPQGKVSWKTAAARHLLPISVGRSLWRAKRSNVRLSEFQTPSLFLPSRTLMTQIHLTSDILGQVMAFIPTKRDLLACALVSRTWVYPAQRLLFRSLRIRRPWPAEGDLAALQRILAALESSPHLARLIRRLDMYIVPRLVERIAALPFTNLVHCTLIAATYSEEELAASIPAVRAIVAHTTLRSVRFHGPFVSSKILTAMLHGCSPNITDLNLLTAKAYSDRQTVHSLAHPPTIYLNQLSLSHSAYSSFTHPSLSFDLSRLHTLRITEWNLLATIPLPLTQLTMLHVTTSPEDAGIPRLVKSSICHLTSLRHLSVAVDPRSFPQFVNGLLDVPPLNLLDNLHILTCLSAFRITSRADRTPQYVDAARHALSRLDMSSPALLLRLPRLRRVVMAEMWPVRTSPEVISAVRILLPRLTQQLIVPIGVDAYTPDGFTTDY
ncbi:hypothetical protein B0H11DRAFT_1930565 [Mycena galericulata]|nr:hypothetical protein B0H11DRAFT_1930565 [Mycena galericulata]